MKYLESIQEELGAFYKGSPGRLVDAVSQFFNTLKKMHLQPGRSYNDRTHMASLFLKVSGRMLQTCKSHMRNAGDNLWDHPSEALIATLSDIGALHKHYRESFRVMRDRLHGQNKTYLDFDEDEVFHELDTFCLRVGQVSHERISTSHTQTRVPRNVVNWPMYSVVMCADM